MKSLRNSLVEQFGNPAGFLGWIVGLIMRFRTSNRQRIKRTIDTLAIAPTDRVLEIGFGPGLGVERAAARAHEGIVIGIDHSELMVREAQSRNRKAIRAGRVKLLLGSVDALPETTRDFDKVFAINVFMFWDDPVDVLKKVRAHMKPGATIALTLQPRKKGAKEDDARLAAANISQALADAGFVDVRSEFFAISPVGAACVLARVKGA